MTVERIREAVLSEAREEAEEIDSEARSRQQERLESAKQELEEEFQERFEEARRETERRCERRVLQKRAEHNLALLRKRNAILDDLFDRAADQIRQMPDEQYRELIAGWMQEVPSDTPGRLLCNEEDEERLRPLIQQINDEREAEAALELVPGDRPEEGGVIFSTEKFEVDMSVETRITDLRERLAPEVAQQVFPEDLSL